MNISTLTAHNSNLFEIDAELEAAFDQMQEEREITGNSATKVASAAHSCFAELGKKIDRIAAYLRIQQHKANIVAEEAQRLQQRRRSAQQRVSDVKRQRSPLRPSVRAYGWREGTMQADRLEKFTVRSKPTLAASFSSCLSQTSETNSSPQEICKFFRLLVRIGLWLDAAG